MDESYITGNTKTKDIVSRPNRDPGRGTQGDDIKRGGRKRKQETKTRCNDRFKRSNARNETRRNI